MKSCYCGAKPRWFLGYYRHPEAYLSVSVESVARMERERNPGSPAEGSPRSAHAPCKADEPLATPPCLRLGCRGTADRGYSWGAPRVQAPPGPSRRKEFIKKLLRSGGPGGGPRSIAAYFAVVVTPTSTGAASR